MGDDMATSQDFVNWVCTEAVEPHWLKLLFIAEKQALLGYSSQSTNVATIFYPELLAFHVCLPSPQEQREIVRQVERLMALASKAERAYEEGTTLLPRLTNSILTKAFRGELARQDPNDEPAAALLARVRAADASSDAPKPRRRRSEAAE